MMAILLTAAPLAPDSPNPLELSGKFTLAGFEVRVAGQSDLDRLAALSKSASLLGSSHGQPVIGERGRPATADLDLTFAGPWMTPADSTTGTLTTTQGWVRIEHAQAKLDWLPEAVEIASATATFSPGKVTWSNASITINGITAHGSYIFPLHCDAAGSCAASDVGVQDNTVPVDAGHFNLDIPTLDAAALESALTGAGRHGELLSAILAQMGRKTAPWPPVSGTVHVGALYPWRPRATRRTPRVERARGPRGGCLARRRLIGWFGSPYRETWKPQEIIPAYSLNLNWEGIDMAQTAAIFHEKWGAGTMNGNARFSLEGHSASDLAASATGTFHWDWTNGSLV